MKREPRWIPASVVRAIHERLIAEHGGEGIGVDEGRLAAALAAPRQLHAYAAPDAFALAASYAHAITRSHPFVDGNKRVALTLAGLFLELNGRRLEAGEADTVAAILALSTRKLDAESFARWLEANSRSVRRRPRRQAP